MTEGDSGGDNVITPEEFFDLEKQEKEVEKKKEGRLGFLGGKKEDLEKSADVFGAEMRSSSSADAMGGSPGITDLSIRLERLGGRLEMLEDGRKATELRLSDFSEKIGELRSSLVERDRTLNEVSARFEKLLDATQDLEPQNISRSLQKNEQKLEQANAQIESNSEKVSHLMERMNDMHDAMEQISGMKDLVSVAEELNKKIQVVDSVKRDIERTAGKFETRLYDLTDTLNHSKAALDRVDANGEAIRELLRSVDELSLKTESLAKKDVLLSKEKSLDGKMSEMRFDLEAKIEKLAEIIGKFKSDSGLGVIAELQKEVRVVSEESAQYKKHLESRIEKLEKELKASKEKNKELKSHLKSGAKAGGLDKKTEANLKREFEMVNKRFADIDMKLLELSKSVDHRIERRVTQETRNTRDSMVQNTSLDGGRASFSRTRSMNFGSAGQMEKTKASESLVSPSREEIHSLIKEVYSLLDAGNITAARSRFIRLLSTYESLEDSNPFVLAKITDIHGRLKEYS